MILFAQQNKLNLECTDYAGNYLGMKQPGITPQKFAPDFISMANQFDQCLVFSPDGNQLVYVWADSVWQHYGMIYAKRTSGKWTRKNILQYKSSDKVPFNPTFSGDSKEIIFGMAVNGWPDTDIYTLGLYDSAYDSIPVRMNTPINTPMLDFDYFIDKDSTIYFTGKRDDFVGGTFDVYMCKKVNGHYVTTNLWVLNSILDDAAPYISPDGSYLVYEQMVNDKKLPYNDSTARIIKVELFVSFRDKMNNWSKPINLGPSVNPKASRTYRPVISSDGKFLFYTQRNDKGADIYWVSTKLIEKLRPK